MVNLSPSGHSMEVMGKRGLEVSRATVMQSGSDNAPQHYFQAFHLGYAAAWCTFRAAVRWLCCLMSRMWCGQRASKWVRSNSQPWSQAWPRGNIDTL